MRCLLYANGGYEIKNVPERIPDSWLICQDVPGTYLVKESDPRKLTRFDTMKYKRYGAAFYVYDEKIEGMIIAYHWFEFHLEGCGCNVCISRGDGELTNVEMFERACFWELFDKGVRRYEMQTSKHR